MEIRDRIITIDKNIISAEAERLFDIGCGLNREGGRIEKMRKSGWKIREAIEDRISPRVVCSFFDHAEIIDRTAVIGDKAFTCNGFSQVDPEVVEGACIYILTAGDFDMDDRPVLEQVYAYIWGTAFTDAAREYLKHEILGYKKVSDAFGPGFYGMDMTQMQDLAALADAHQIGVDVKQSGLLVPLKSCAGIYFEVTDDYRKMKKECGDCWGNPSGCSMCNIANIQS